MVSNPIICINLYLAFGVNGGLDSEEKFKTQDSDKTVLKTLYAIGQYRSWTSAAILRVSSEPQFGKFE